MRDHQVTHLACADEVGRGALCGPVTIGMVVITERTRTAPVGVRDSKLLSAAARDRLAPLVRRWAVSHAVGHASADEIDTVGIMGALRVAGQRALAQLDPVPDLVLLDGNHDYLSPPGQPGLFGDPESDGGIVQASGPALGLMTPPVVTRIKADMVCAGVAAASILAKTARDAIMLDLSGQFPEYGWSENKGYSAPEHIEALATRGPSSQHRLSWRLPGVMVPTARLTTSTHLQEEQ